MMRAAIYLKRLSFINNEGEACREYILSNISKSTEIFTYEDEINMNDKYEDLINDIKEKNIDMVVCYRLDMMGISEAQLLDLLEVIINNNCNFISVTERYFDTTTCLGKTLINLALTFLRNKKEEDYKKEYWNVLQIIKGKNYLGKSVPLGFYCEKLVYIDKNLQKRTVMKLKMIESERRIVRLIFNAYKENKSIDKIIDILNMEIGKNRIKLNSKKLKEILLNPLYIISDEKSHQYLTEQGMNIFGIPNGNGYLNIVYKNEKNNVLAVSNHKGIIPSEDWICVNKFLRKTKYIFEEC